VQNQSKHIRRFVCSKYMQLMQLALTKANSARTLVYLAVETIYYPLDSRIDSGWLVIGLGHENNKMALRKECMEYERCLCRFGTNW
jgi:hypothetical protein